jgi:peptidoglycan/LPS O-acetylase OafA/YrhL
VLGGALLLVEKLPRVSWPLVATGQLALSVYVGHLLLLDAYEELLRHEALPAAATTMGVFMLLAATTCTLWRGACARASEGRPRHAVVDLRTCRPATHSAWTRRTSTRGSSPGKPRVEDHRTKRATAKSQVRE